MAVLGSGRGSGRAGDSVRGRLGAGHVLAVAGALVIALALALDAPAVRLTAALLVCLVLPGLGWARRLRLRDLGDTVALTVVLSMSLTAVVATGMAVTRTWSASGGLVVLVAITVLGFVPVRSVAARAVTVLRGRATLTPRRPVAVEVGETEDGWTDWYADARDRADEERRRREAEAEAAEQEWRDWYAESRRLVARDRDRGWGDPDPDGAGAGSATDGAGDGADEPANDRADEPANHRADEPANHRADEPAIDEARVVRTGSVFGRD